LAAQETNRHAVHREHARGAAALPDKEAMRRGLSGVELKDETGGYREKLHPLGRIAIRPIYTTNIR